MCNILSCFYFYSFSLGTVGKTLKISQLTERSIKCPICHQFYELEEMNSHYSDEHLGFVCPEKFTLSKEEKIASLRSNMIKK